MIRVIKSTILAICSFMLLLNSVAAVPNEVASILHKGAGSRAMGMAENYAAIAEGPFGQLYNPAGLAVGQGVMLGFHHESASYSSEHEGIAGRIGIGPGSLGLLVNFYDYGDVAYRDLSGQLTGDSARLQETSFQMGYGFAINSMWRAGINIKAYVINLGESTLTGGAMDLGVLIDVGQGFALAGVIKNMGEKYEEYDLPATLRLATAYTTLANKLVIDAEFDISLADAPSDFGLGAEYQFLPWLDARLGFKTSLEQNNYSKGVATAGAGLNFGNFGLDINFAGRTMFGGEFGAALVYNFSGPRHQPPIITNNVKTPDDVPANQTAQIEKLKKIKAAARPAQEAQQERRDRINSQDQKQASYHLEAGQEYEKYGQLIDAIIEYKAALKIQPNYRAAQQALSAARKKAKTKALALEKKSPSQTTISGKQNGSLQKLIRKYYVKGQTAYNRKDYSEAIKQLQLVLEMTDKHRQATDLLKKAKTALTNEMSSLNNQAKKAKAKNDLPAEVEAYQNMLDLDPENNVIKSKLALAKKRIPKEVDRLYKNGIDLYAKQNFRKALKAFERVLKLQPNHVKAKDAVENIKEKLIQTGQ